MPVTDEEVVRELMCRYTNDVRPSASIAAQVVVRQRRRDRRRAISMTATVAVLGTAAGVIASHPGPGGRSADTPGRAVRLTAAQRTLYDLSAAAGRGPQGPGRYAVLTENKDGNSDTSVIDGTTGDMWAYQKGVDGAPSGAAPVSRHWSPTAAQFAAMPLSLAALRKTLVTQYDQQWQRDEDMITPQRRRHIPAAGLKAAGSADDRAFEQATIMLWNPLVPPALRAALFKVLAATPGVKVDASAHDTAGRPAVKISRTDSVSATVYTALENPRTGAVLELTDTYPANSGISSGYDLVLSVTSTDTVPPDPYQG